MMDQNNSQPIDNFRIQVAERLVRLESRVCAIAAEITKNTAMTADVVDLLRGIRTIGKLLIWAASVAAAITALLYLFRQSL